MSKKLHIILFNPRSANSKYRIPNSILQVAGSVCNKYTVDFVDGNLEQDPEKSVLNYLRPDCINIFGSTVMPGPQLKQAIPISKSVKDKHPNTIVVWGGYFASNQYKAVLNSPFVDYVFNGPADTAFPKLLECIESNNYNNLKEIKNLIFNDDGVPFKTATEALPVMDNLPELPYDLLNKYYPIPNYLGNTYLGSKTIAYHSSFGCPFTCSFCAVVPIYKARWKGFSANRVINDIEKLRNDYGGNAIEFHDNNFFVSEKRVVEFSNYMLSKNMSWWGEGRIDTIDKYSDESLALMSEAGCKMIFFGAETGNDDVLKQMDKGGTQSAEQILRFAERIGKFNIIPEYSFVLGMPADTEEQVWKQIKADVEFIRKVKEVNPKTEIIIYMYSPVPTEGSELYEQITKAGFEFPDSLEKWMDPSWEKFDLRKNPLTPWLTKDMVDYIRNFETVLNGFYPTVSDVRLGSLKRKIVKLISYLRYRFKVYTAPYEIKVLHKIWKYRQPEIEGF